MTQSPLHRQSPIPLLLNPTGSRVGQKAPSDIPGLGAEEPRYNPPAPNQRASLKGVIAKQPGRTFPDQGPMLSSSLRYCAGPDAQRTPTLNPHPIQGYELQPGPRFRAGSLSKAPEHRTDPLRHGSSGTPAFPGACLAPRPETPLRKPTGSSRRNPGARSRSSLG